MLLYGQRRLVAGKQIAADGNRAIVPVHALLRLRLGAVGRVALYGELCTPIGVLERSAGRRWHGVPVVARGPAGLLAGLLVAGLPRTRFRRAIVQRQPGGTAMVNQDSRGQTRTENESSWPDAQLLSAVGRAAGAETIAGALAAAARPEAAVGQAIAAHGFTAVPLLETMFGGGYGIGLGGGTGPRPDGAPGSSGGGGGGGGGGRSRAVAIVVVGPDGVQVRPVVDVTKLGLAAIAAALGLLGIARWRRR
ncbi:MAG TPA: hypothetical protein VKV26_02570 [Dehalococcoidia bacterium]|nr:hypothetical protein [Dehalococcoidia bacterium]